MEKLKKTQNMKNLYSPFTRDSGGAIGAAALTIFNQTKKSFSFSDNPYLGPKFSNNDINNSLKKFSKKFNENNIAVKQYNNKRLLLEDIAKAISEKEIIGIFNGRMEWGPRALGNRSIIADARHKDIKDIINLKLKKKSSCLLPHQY